MNKYVYDITGEYKDWLKMKRGDDIIHNGSLIGLISFSNDRLELKLNYGQDAYYFCEIKRMDNIIITVPIEKYLLKDDYIFIPLAFDKEEYKEFIDITYIDRKLLDNIRQVNKRDIYNMLTVGFRLKFSILQSLIFEDIINNIIAFSEEDKIAKCINIMLSNENVKLYRIDKNGLKYITLFIDFSGKLYEWNSVIKTNDKFYFKLFDDYVLELI